MIATHLLWAAHRADLVRTGEQAKPSLDGYSSNRHIVADSCCEFGLAD